MIVDLFFRKMFRFHFWWWRGTFPVPAAHLDFGGVGSTGAVAGTAPLLRQPACVLQAGTGSPNILTFPDNISLNIWHGKKPVFLCFAFLGWHASEFKVQEFSADRSPHFPVALVGVSQWYGQKIAIIESHTSG